MSLKGVEMQIAVPRTNEIANVQNHLNQKPAYDQAAQAFQSAKKTERKRSVSAEIESSQFMNIGNEEQSPGDGRPNGGKRKAGKRGDPRSPTPDHPYKGKHIDISL